MFLTLLVDVLGVSIADVSSPIQVTRTDEVTWTGDETLVIWMPSSEIKTSRKPTPTIEHIQTHENRQVSKLNV